MRSAAQFQNMLDIFIGGSDVAPRDAVQALERVLQGLQKRIKLEESFATGLDVTRHDLISAGFAGEQVTDEQMQLLAHAFTNNDRLMEVWVETLKLAADSLELPYKAED